MTLVTDPKLLAELNGSSGGESQGGRPSKVTDPNILAELNGQPAPKNDSRDTFMDHVIDGTKDFALGAAQSAINFPVGMANAVLRQQGPKGILYGKQIPEANFAPDSTMAQIGGYAPLVYGGGKALISGGKALLGTPLAQKGIGAIEQAVLRPRGTAADARQIINSVPKEMQNNLPLGELVDSAPLLNTQQGALANIPLSGMGKPYEALNKYVGNESEGLINKFTKGQDIVSPDKDLYRAVSKNYEKTKQDVGDAYKKFGDIASKENLNYDRTAFDNAIKANISNLSDQIKISPVSAKRIDPLIEQLQLFGKSDLSNFKNVEQVRKDVNEEWALAHAEKNGVAKNILNQLRDSLDHGLLKSSEENPLANQALLDARNLYKTKQLPFEHLSTVDETGKRILSKEASPFIKVYKGNKASPDGFIDKYIKKGNDQDAVDLAQDLLNKTPEEAKDLIKYGSLKSGFKEGEVNPRQLMKEYGRLGPQQRSAIFGQDQAKLDQLHQLSKTYPEIFNVDFVPKTGFTAGKYQQWKEALSKLATPGAAVAGNVLGGPIGAVIGAGAVSGGANMARKLLTSPSYREGFLKRMETRENMMDVLKKKAEKK